MDIGSRDLQLDESLGLNCAWYADILRVRPSVRKYPCPWKRSPKAEAMPARRATGRWCRVSWKPSGKPTTSTEVPTSMSASESCR